MDRTIFFDRVRALPFRGLVQSQVDGINSILDAWDRSELTDPGWLGYLLATVYHETDRTMQPIEEIGHGRGHAYGQPAGPWRQVYDGRGDIQLTWEANYRHATTRLRQMGVIDATVDLEKTPALAMRPDIAAAILIYGCAEGWFTGRRLSMYIGGSKRDFYHARQIVNGMDRAMLIAGYAEEFYAAITAAQPKE